MKKAILHIGTEKTGTTTLQRCFAAARDKLASAGFWYPVGAGRNWDPISSNHYALPMYAIGRVDGLSQELFRIAGAGREPHVVLPAVRDQLLQEHDAAAAAGQHTAIFSSEFMHSRLYHVEQIDRLKLLLDERFSEYEVIVYLRRQDQMAASLYSTLLETGETSPRIVPDPTRITPDYFDFQKLISRWVEVFGEAAIRPRIYERRWLMGSDIVDDFVATAGIPQGLLSSGTAQENASLSRQAQSLLCSFNAYAKRSNLENPQALRARLGPLLRAAFPGSSAKLSSEEAEGFLARYAAGNEAVRQRWFPNRASLFEPVQPTKPDGNDTLMVNEAALLDLSLGILATLLKSEGQRPKQ